MFVWQVCTRCRYHYCGTRGLSAKGIILEAAAVGTREVEGQTVAEDYFSAMQKVEKKLEISPKPEETSIEDVKVQDHSQVFQLIKRLECPELCFEERLLLAGQLREAMGMVNEHAPPIHFSTTSNSKSTNAGLDQVILAQYFPGGSGG